MLCYKCIYDFNSPDILQIDIVKNKNSTEKVISNIKYIHTTTIFRENCFAFITLKKKNVFQRFILQSTTIPLGYGVEIVTYIYFFTSRVKKFKKV